MGKDFNLTDEQIQDAINKNCDEDRTNVDEVRANIESLKDGGGLWDYDNAAYSSVKQLCRDYDLVIGSIDGGPEDGQIINVLTENNLPKFKKAIENEN